MLAAALHSLDRNAIAFLHTLRCFNLVAVVPAEHPDPLAEELLILVVASSPGCAHEPVVRHRQLPSRAFSGAPRDATGRPNGSRPLAVASQSFRGLSLAGVSTTLQISMQRPRVLKHTWVAIADGKVQTSRSPFLATLPRS